MFVVDYYFFNNSADFIVFKPSSRYFCSEKCVIRLCIFKDKTEVSSWSERYQLVLQIARKVQVMSLFLSSFQIDFLGITCFIHSNQNFMKLIVISTVLLLPKFI